MKTLLTSSLIAALALASCSEQRGTLSVNPTNDTLTTVHIKNAPKYILLPIEESQDEAQVMLDGTPMDVRLAVNHVDYTVPFPLHEGAESDSLVIRGLSAKAVTWKQLELADTFDTANREKFRPVYHHTPAYGWMNDANGLVYKDGEYHLYFQYNPYGSKWGNMHWGHSVSKDLVHWTRLEPAIARDTMGHIFSGSCIVDKDNTAGFGANAIVAFYTSHKSLPGGHQRQQQCMAWSTDNGRTFHKYEGNPVVTPFDGLEDFRDPKVFWYAPEKKWVMIVSADKNMRFYESADLKQWTYMSQWGAGYGPQPNQFECPDFVEMPVDGNEANRKWVMIVNINPGFVYGGSGTMYFTGNFDGHRFTCDTKPDDVKWLDWGKDHYATVTYSNTGRRVIAMPWMSNWQYANLTPTQQFRSQNALPRELRLFTSSDGRLLLSAAPVKETAALRDGKATSLGRFALSDGKNHDVADVPSTDGAFELQFTLTPGTARECGVELRNAKGERVVISYDAVQGRVVMDRAESGITKFGDDVQPHQIETSSSRRACVGRLMHFKNDFALATWAPVPFASEATHDVHVFVDKSSVELFVDGGRVAMTNLVFPNAPYSSLNFFARGGEASVGNANVWKLK